MSSLLQAPVCACALIWLLCAIVARADDGQRAGSAALQNLAEMADDPVRFLGVARKALQWDEPAEPAQIVGPVYFVGTQGLSVFLITTPDGHIVLNTGMPGSGPLIAASIRQLGFDPRDIELLLIGHAHCDHVGGHAYLHELSGAKIVALAEEQQLMESGGRSDFHNGSYPEFGFDAAPVQQVVKDGEAIELGGLKLTALRTNGHTRGSATYVMDLVEDGQTYKVVFPNGTSVNPGYRLVNDPSYPGIKDDFERTFRTLASLQPDIWLMPHNDAYGLFDRLERAKTAGIKAWLDRDGYRQWVTAQHAKFLAAVENETGAAAASTPVRVTVDNFTRAESDTYVAKFVKDGGLGKFAHERELVPVEKQAVIRMNRDTLYSSGVFDLAAGPVTITLPETGKRFLSLQVINEDHYTPEVIYTAGAHTLTQESVGTRYVVALVRTFVNPNDAADVKAVHALQDAIKVEQASPGKLELPDWDQASLSNLRTALNALAAANGGLDSTRMFGRKDQVDPVQHLIGTAAGWGGNPREDALYAGETPAHNDGQQAYRLTLRDVPVDGFWSVSVYNKAGFFEKNDRNAYTLNNVTAQPEADGSVTIQFGACDGSTPNCLPITPGWNYVLRLYRPRPAILDGNWKIPKAEPVQ